MFISFIYLFIYRVAVWLISEQRISKHASCKRNVTRSNTTTLSQIVWTNLRKFCGYIDAFQANIWSLDVPNTKQECQLFDIILAYVIFCISCLNI